MRHLEGRFDLSSKLSEAYIGLKQSFVALLNACDSFDVPVSAASTRR